MIDSAYPSQQQDKFVLRLPDGMRDRIKAAAAENNRSMNAEIVSALEFWLDWKERPILPDGRPAAPVPVNELRSDDIYEIIEEAVREALSLYQRRSQSPAD